MPVLTFPFARPNVPRRKLISPLKTTIFLISTKILLRESSSRSRWRPVCRPLPWLKKSEKNYGASPPHCLTAASLPQQPPPGASADPKGYQQAGKRVKQPVATSRSKGSCRPQNSKGYGVVATSTQNALNLFKSQQESKAPLPACYHPRRGSGEARGGLQL